MRVVEEPLDDERVELERLVEPRLLLELLGVRPIPLLERELLGVREVPEERLVPDEERVADPDGRLVPLDLLPEDPILDDPIFDELPLLRLEPLLRETPPLLRDEPPEAREELPELPRVTRCASTFCTGAAKTITASTANSEKTNFLGVNIDDLRPSSGRAMKKAPAAIPCLKGAPSGRNHNAWNGVSKPKKRICPRPLRLL